MSHLFTFISLLLGGIAFSQPIAVLKYKGGGDWYSNPTSLTNLIKFCNKNISTNIAEKYEIIEPKSKDIFKYPYVYMTGHGNVFFSEKGLENLRTYLLSGGFLHIDDNYGMREYAERELKKLFPNKKLEEVYSTHILFKKPYLFKDGLPKVHEHDNKPPQAFGIFEGERLLLLFTYESDLGDGWENQEVHNNPESLREEALKMGANIIYYVYNQEFKIIKDGI